ncbi:hypothetical protein PUN28_011010 [Cardiocondyla obscurior]|uniref:Uncharacterized protein n=1 Tax=Cardiocondyla obscurior TaxID=286306 RepID=A0AAW2FNY4_9HYME
MRETRYVCVCVTWRDCCRQYNNTTCVTRPARFSQEGRGGREGREGGYAGARRDSDDEGVDFEQTLKSRQF